MKICIIRHGETEWNKAGRLQGREDIPLNETGIHESKKVAQYLSKMKWHEIISSPLSRTAQTSQIIAHELGITTIQYDIGFIERDFGKASGLTPQMRASIYPDGNYEGMEELDTLQKRVFDALHKYVGLYKDKDIIIVSHGGAINSLLATLSNGEIGSGKTRLKTSCINLLEETGEKIKIVYYNKSVDELSQPSILP